MKRIAAWFGLWAAVAIAACDIQVEVGHPMFGGQTGQGAPQPNPPCRRTSECEMRMQGFGRGLLEPAPVSKLAEANCVALEDETIERLSWKAPGACRCRFPCRSQDGQEISGFQCNARPFAEVYFGINYRGSENDWCWPGDRMGRCLIADDEAHGCDPDGEDTCLSECKLLEQRWHAERTKAHEIEVRGIECIDPCEAAYCRAIVRVDDECFINYPKATGGYDCAQSDAEILSAAGIAPNEADYVKDEDAGVCYPRAQPTDEDAGAP
jgi:hypothetical protein